MLADQDVQKLVEKRFQREKASYDTSYTTLVGLAETALTEAREFVLKGARDSRRRTRKGLHERSLGFAVTHESRYQKPDPF